jgi:hypothetical protein
MFAEVEESEGEEAVEEKGSEDAGLKETTGSRL